MGYETAAGAHSSSWYHSQKGRSALEFPIVAEGEIWEVKFDPALYERGLMTEVGKVPPVFVCSEDGILALLQGGQYPSPSPSPCSFVIS